MKIEISLLINFLTEKEKNKDLLIIGKEYPFFLIHFIKKILTKKEIIFFTKVDQDENIFFDFSENENLNKKKCLFHSFLEKETTDEIFELIKNNKKYYNLIFIQKEIVKNYKKKDFTFLDSDALISIADFLNLEEFFEKKYKKYIEIIFKKFKTISLCKFFWLINYSDFLRISNFENFLETFENEIYKDQYSIFDLSTFFFKKNKKDFYFLWNILKNNYESEFWNVYWLKQLWQAYKFLDEKEENNFNYKYNLPFWFIKFGKSKFKKDDFEKPLLELYNQDIFLKNLGLDNNNKVYACEKIFLDWF